MTTWLDLLEPRRSGAGGSWRVMGVPLDLLQKLPQGAAECGDGAYLRVMLEEAGVPRKVAARWPCPLGYRVVVRLAQRGQIAYALASSRADLLRLGRQRVGKFNAVAVRLSPEDVIRALALAGGDVRRGREPGADQ